MKLWSVALIIVYVGLNTVAIRADTAHAQSFDLSSMAFRIGTWQCMGHNVGKMRYPFVSITDMPYDGHWVRTRNVLSAAISLQNRPFYDDQFWTYQPDTKSWVGIDLDNTGEYWFGWSSGWVDNRFISAGYYASHGKNVRFRNIFIKVSDRMIEDRYEEPNSSGAPQLTYSDICWKSTIPSPRPLPQTTQARG